MIKAIFQTATLKQSSVTLFGTLVNGILGTLFYIVTARFLGPADFGLLIVAITSLTLVADIADFGTNTGLVKFVSGNIEKNKTLAYEILKISLVIKLVVWLVILILGYILAPFIAEYLFRKEELVTPLRLSFIGVGGALLFTFATSALQSLQKFFTWSLINITTNFLRLIFIIVLFYVYLINSQNSLIVYVAMPFLGFFLALLFLPTKDILSARTSLPNNLLRFNLAVAVFTVFAAISARLDTFIAARLLSAHDVGIYGSATQLTSAIPQLISALGVVAAPKFASFDTKEKMMVYMKKFQLLVIGIALVGLLAIPLGYIFIPIVYGVEYVAAITPFVILLIAMLVFLISIPIHNSIFYYFGKPEVFIWVAVGHLIIIGSLGFYLINQFGINGAALTVLVGTIFNFLVPLIWFLKKIAEKD